MAYNNVTLRRSGLFDPMLQSGGRLANQAGGFFGGFGNPIPTQEQKDALYQGQMDINTNHNNMVAAQDKRKLDKTTQAKQNEWLKKNLARYPDLLQALAAGQPPQEVMAEAQKRMAQEGKDAQANTLQAAKDAAAGERNDADIAAAAALAKAKGVKGTPMLAHTAKQYTVALDAASDAGTKRHEYTGLAQQVEANKDKFQRGVVSSAWEGLKNVTGERNIESRLRTQYARMRASEAVSNLPPGPASDKDIALALQGFPPMNAGPEEIAGFARGMALIQEYEEQYQRERAKFINENREEVGFLTSWEASEWRKQFEEDNWGDKKQAEQPKTSFKDLP